MEEKLAILKMIEEKKITPEEGAKLLEALDGKTSELSLANTNKPSAKWIKIKIKDDDNTVNVNLPIALVDIAFKIARSSNKDFDIKFNDMNINIDNIVNLIKEGAEGKIVDIKGNDGETVEIIVE